MAHLVQVLVLAVVAVVVFGLVTTLVVDRAVGTGGSGRPDPAAPRQPVVTPATAAARRNRSSSICSVRRPVNVLCWLGW